MKSVDGIMFFDDREPVTPKFSQTFKVIEWWTVRFLSVFLGAAFVAILFAWYVALQPPTYTMEEMRMFSLMEINRIH